MMCLLLKLGNAGSPAQHPFPSHPWTSRPKALVLSDRDLPVYCCPTTALPAKTCLEETRGSLVIHLEMTNMKPHCRTPIFFRHELAMELTLR